MSHAEIIFKDVAEVSSIVADILKEDLGEVVILEGNIARFETGQTVDGIGRTLIRSGFYHVFSENPKLEIKITD
jgi:hypothetical protein